MKPGDLIQTNLMLIGEVVGIDDDKIEVYFLVPDLSKAKGKIWVYKNNWDTILKSDIIKHIEIKDKNLYPKYYKQMGFKAWDGEIFTRTDVDIEQDNDLRNYPFPTGCDTEDDEDDYDYEDGFIVKDNDAEEFTFAPIDTDFVQQTHEAVNEYNKWQPKNKRQLSIKHFIDEIELKYSTLDDDKHFENGTSIDYKNPPMAPRASKRHKSFTNK